MLDKLYYIQSILPELLLESDWNTLDINYEKPHVQRVWRQVDDLRVSLHRIFPCKINECFFHPHPWPSAMKIESGRYEMALGYGTDLNAKLNIATIILSPGSYYEMTDIDSWHSVRPLGGPVMSLMVTGKPWGRQMPKSDRIQLSCLTDETKFDIMGFFRRVYPSVK